MLIALIGKAYTGKTSIAQELRDRHNFTILSFTDHLKSLAAYALNSVSGGRPHFSVEGILSDKPRYRRFIQEFGSLIGYETDPGWITAFLADELPTLYPEEGDDEPNLVIDCLRSAAQIAGAREFGAKIVGVWAYEYDRAFFAEQATGKDGSALVANADSHPIDGSLVVERLGCDRVLLNGRDRTVEKMVDDLLGQIKFVEAL